MEANLDLTKLSRTVSHALRHEPWLYGLELDSYGWVRLIDLVVCLRRHKNEWRKLAENDIIEMISKSVSVALRYMREKSGLYTDIPYRGRYSKCLYNRRQFYFMVHLQGS